MRGIDRIKRKIRFHCSGAEANCFGMMWASSVMSALPFAISAQALSRDSDVANEAQN